MKKEKTTIVVAGVIIGVIAACWYSLEIRQIWDSVLLLPP